MIIGTTVSSCKLISLYIYMGTNPHALRARCARSTYLRLVGAKEAAPRVNKWKHFSLVVQRCASSLRLSVSGTKIEQVCRTDLRGIVKTKTCSRRSWRLEVQVLFVNHNADDNGKVGKFSIQVLSLLLKVLFC